jgi:hypothetical protein
MRNGKTRSSLTISAALWCKNLRFCTIVLEIERCKGKRDLDGVGMDFITRVLP